MSQRFKQSLRAMAKAAQRDLLMLKSDPHFQSVINTLEEFRMRYYRNAAGASISQKDQDKYLGAAGAVDELLMVLTQDVTTSGDTDDTGG